MGEIDFALENLKQWMKPVSVPTPVIAKPSTSKIVHDPKGVVLVRLPCLLPCLLLPAHAPLSIICITISVV